MNEAETRKALAKCSALDNRKVTDAAIIMWFDIFRDVTYAEVEWAMMHHYRTSTDYLMPAHLLIIIGEKRTEYRWMNPGESLSNESWLEFEQMQELAAEQCRERRASGATYAVDAMAKLELEQ